MPENTLSDAIFAEYDDASKEYRIDVIWYHLNQIQSPIGNNFPFNLLWNPEIGYLKIDAYLLNLVPHDFWRQIATLFFFYKSQIETCY